MTEELHLKDYNEFNPKEFSYLIWALEKFHFEYFVFGGFAYDGITGEMHDHEDLDIVGMNNQRDTLRHILKLMDYKGYRVGQRDAFLKDKNRIDLIYMTQKQDYFEIVGNITQDRISKEAFSMERRVSRDGINFTIMPYEWFLLNGQEHYKGDDKKPYISKAIEKIKPFCNSFPVLKQVNIGKPQDMRKIPI